MPASAETDFLLEHGPAIEDAARRIAGRVVRTPCLMPVDMPGVAVKPECLQPTGSFKVRGAFNAMLSLLERRPDAPGIVTVSSGNHGQAVAYASRTLGLPAVVVMPETASPVKREAVLRLGARVLSDGVTTANREERFVEVVSDTGFEPIHPFDNWDVIHGQGTTGLEIADQAPEATTVVVPIGGGGLVSGIVTALRHRGHGARVVGVEPATADDARRSLAAGEVQSFDGGGSIADGALARRIGERPAEVLLGERLVEDIVTVTDEELLDHLPRIWAQTRLLVEPTGALALTAVLLGRVGAPAAGPMVAVVSGGNVDPRFVGELRGTDR
jgi:threonine dehydratase